MRGKAALPRQGAEHGGDLIAQLRAHQLPGGGAHGQGVVPPRGVEAVDSGVGNVSGDGGPAGVRRGLIPVAGIGD